MSQIEASDNTVRLCRGCDFLDVEQLTSEKVHAAKHHYGQLVCMLLDEIENVFRANYGLTFARSRENQRILRIEPMVRDLCFYRVGVGRKSRFFHHDLEARFRWSIKRGHHQVKIHCE